MSEKLTPEQFDVEPDYPTEEVRANVEDAFKEKESDESIAEILKMVENEYLKGVDDECLRGEITDPQEYFNKLKGARARFLEDEEDKNVRRIGETIFLSSLVLESSMERRMGTGRKVNLALLESRWQIAIARHFNTFRDDPGIVEFTKLYLKRFKKTNTLTKYLDKHDVEGIVRGVKGMLGLISSFRDAGIDDENIIMPTPQEDAEKKVDLFVELPEQNQTLAVQLKTFSNINRARIGFAEEAEHDKHHVVESAFGRRQSFIDFKRDLNTLGDYAKSKSQKEGLTCKPCYVIIPESWIGDDFSASNKLTTRLKNILLKDRGGSNV